MMNNSRERLMKAYQAYSFAAYDALLYLDAYPDNKEAMAFYNKYQRLAGKARSEYENAYGPISAPNEANNWQWADSPWPWHIEGGK